MKLTYRIPLSLTAILLPIIILWAILFYYKMVDEINDEADDALEDYAELIIIRALAGQELPQPNNGSNNSYWITPIDNDSPVTAPYFHYYDSTVFIPEKAETEPARVLSTFFRDNNNALFELKVAIPTFEKEDLSRSILNWMVVLYLLLFIAIIGLAVWIFNYNMRPLYALLHWLDNYTPGGKNTQIPNTTTVTEFRKLNEAAQQAVTRSETLFEHQKQFIGNVSHELQTPLAILGNRLEWLTNNATPNKAQIEEFLKMQHTINQIVRLNKNLLLLAKIDNGQFPLETNIDLSAIVREQVEIYNEIYASTQTECRYPDTEPFCVNMNESLASTLVANLLKNAYVHSPQGSKITIRLNDHTLLVFNKGETSLDAGRIFDRFYQQKKKEGSSGLGLALVGAICRLYGLQKAYRFEQGEHCFKIRWN